MAGFITRFFNKRVSKDVQINSARSTSFYNSGNPVTVDTAMEVSAYYRGVIYIASQIAKLPMYVKDKNNQVLNNPLTTILNLRPNPEMTAFAFKNLAIQCVINRGNAYAEIQRNVRGEIIALWPIPFDSVQPMRTLKGNLVYKIVDGYSRGEDSYLMPEEILHLKNFHTYDGIIGQPTIGWAKNALSISMGADKMANSIFTNGAIPSGILTAPGALSDEAFERIKSSWKENYGGRKAGGVAILEEGLTFTAINIQPDSLQFLESRKFSVLEIARFLGLPPTKLFDMEGAKFANMENANLETATDCLDTWARMIEQECDIKLLNSQYGGNYTQIDSDELFRGDMAARSTYYKNMMSIGAMTPNEVRIKEGMTKYADGDKFYIAVNNYSPADRVDDIIDAQISKGSDPKTTNPSPKTDTPKSELEQAAIDFLMKG